MADTTTELEVLDQIVDVLGGQSGQYETVVPTLQQILALLGGGGGSGYNPSLSVGRADALTGADETSQWATRESTGTGSATVRSVQGAAVGWNQTTPTISSDNWMKNAGVTATFGSGTVRMAYVNDGSTTVSSNRVEVKPAFYAGHGVYQHKYLMLADITPSKDMQAELFLYGRTEQGQGSGRTVLGVKRDVDANVTIRLADIVTETNSDVYEVLIGVGMCGSESRPVLAGDYADVSNAMLFDLTAMFGSGNEPTTVAEFERMYPEPYYPYSAPTLKPVQIAGIRSTDAQGGELDAIEWTAQTLRAAGSVADELTIDELVTRVGERAYQSGDESDATVRTDGTTTYYPLATPTTTPISPALPMTYRVQAGGSEAIIVPAGEISAAPVLTVAEGESAADVVMDALACIAAPDGPVATANHALNTYLTMGGKLYKVTSAIAAGETITPNTNVTETTVMAELLALTA